MIHQSHLLPQFTIPSQSNVLIDDDGHAQLTDFGLAVFTDETISSNRNGSLAWMAPELHEPDLFGLDQFKRTKSSDMYAFGCLFIEVCPILIYCISLHNSCSEQCYTGKPPIYGKEARDRFATMLMLKHIVEGKRPRRPSPPAGRAMSNEIWDIVQRCWRQQPSERPDMDDIVDELASIVVGKRRATG